MSMQSVLGSVYIPLPILGNGFTATAQDTATDKYGWVFQVAKTGNIRKLHIRINTFTSNATLDLRLETIDATTGYPTGTLWGATTNNTIAITATGWYTVTMTADAAVTKGDIVAFVIAQTGSGNVAPCFWSGTTMIRGFPYTVSNQGSWAKLQGWHGIGAVEYDDGSVKESTGLLPWKTVDSTVYGSASSPNTRGLRFKLPFPVRLRGLWVDGIVTVGGSLSIKLYDSDGVTALRTVTYDTDFNALSTTGLRLFEFSSDVDLLANTYYRIAIAPATTNFTLFEATHNSAALMDGFGIGQNGHLTTCAGTPTAEADWTQTLTTWPFIGLNACGFDDGAAKIVHPGMAGGMRG